ncbi:hypothetical protein D9M72_499870 [compost metagenome]
MALRQQHPHGLFRSGGPVHVHPGVVRRCGVPGGIPGPAENGERRAAFLQPPGPGVVGGAGGEDESVQPGDVQKLFVLADFVPVRVGAEEREPVAGRLGCFRERVQEPVQDGAVDAVRGGKEPHAEVHGTLGAQLAGGGAGPVAGRDEGSLDAFPGGGLDLVRGVQHIRDGLPRHGKFASQAGEGGPGQAGLLRTRVLSG